MRLSQRSRQIGESPLRLLNGSVEEVEKKGIQVYRLNIGETDEFPPGEVFNYFSKTKRQKIPYAPSAGLEELKSAWAEYYNQQGAGVEAGDIVVTTGASEALLLTLAALADPDDELIVFEPFYPNYSSIARLIGLKVKSVPLKKNQSGFSAPSSVAIAKSIGPRTKAIIIDNPSNPSGCLYSREDLLMLGRIADENNLSLIVDEVYREIVYDQPSLIALSISELQDRLIVVDSVSKRYSLCGFRLGCIISRHKSFIETIKRFSQSRLSAPLLSQLAVIPVIRNNSTYVNLLRESFKEKRQIVVDGLSGIDNMEMTIPKGAFYTFIRLPIEDSEDFARWLLTEFSYQKQTVLVAPGTGFYLNPEDGRQEFRIAFVPESNKLKKAILVLAEGIKEYLSNK